MEKSTPGILMVISGPAGSGKSSVVELLREKTDEFEYSISATTRERRKNETEGVDYFFISSEEFKRRIDSGEMLEYNVFHGDYYGTPRDFVERTVTAGKNLLLEIDVNGGLQVKAQYPDAVLVFALPPDSKTLECRLRGRGTNTEESIRWRLKRAQSEVPLMKNYDYCVVIGDNNNEGAVNDILGIYKSEKLRARRNHEICEQFFNKRIANAAEEEIK